MAGFDILVLFIVTISMFAGLKKGIISSLVWFFGIILGIATVYFFGEILVKNYMTFLNYSPGINKALGYLIIFFSINLVVGIIGFILKKSLSALFLGWTDKLLGALVAFLVGILVSSFILHTIKYFDSEDKINYSKTKIAYYTYSIMPFLKDVSKETGSSVEVFVDKLIAQLDELVVEIGKLADTSGKKIDKEKLKSQKKALKKRLGEIEKYFGKYAKKLKIDDKKLEEIKNKVKKIRKELEDVD